MWAAQAQAALGRFDADGLAQVAGTRYGELLLARAGLALALAALALRWRRAGPVALRGGLAALLAAGLLLSFALGGHPAAAPAPLLPVLADAIHMAAATLWGGGLLAFATLLPGLLRAAPAERRAALLRAIFARFSGLALACAALLAISGTYATLRELGAPADLWRTAYGLALLVKLAAFGGMLLLGAYHLLAARPALNAWADGVAQAAVDLPGRLGRSLRAEAGLALLALLAAGALTSLAPPADAGSAADLWAQPTPTAIRVPTATPGPTRTPAPSRPFAATEAAGDLLVRLTIAPASIGQNRFQVLVSDAAGRPAATQLVRLTFTMLEMDMGTNTLEAAPAGAGGYAAAGSPLSMVGDWQVTVTVRRAGLRDVAAVFRVPVGE
jgi:copper transport protein